MITYLRLGREKHRQKPSQRDTAAAVGIDQALYCKIEGGSATASPEVAQKLADYFGVEVDQLFTPARYSAEVTGNESAA